VCALLDLPLDQLGISIVINCTAFEGRNERSKRAREERDLTNHNPRLFGRH
jgi:hypothetical protein